MKPTIRTPRNSYRADLPWTADLQMGLIELTGNKSPGYFSKSSYAYRAMLLRGTELASIPWQVKRGDTILKRHSVIDILTEFGPESNWVESIIATEIDLLLTGQAFWLRDYDIVKRLCPTTIEVKTSRSGISSFEQTIGGEIVNRFARDEITYFREYHPEGLLDVGTSSMEVIKDAVDLEREALLYMKAFFKNDATPSLLLTTEQDVGINVRKALLLAWNKAFKGRREAHKVAILDKGMEAQKLSHSMKDNTVVEIRDQARGDICAGLGVPKILVGDLTESTYANAQEARKYMIEDVTLPRARFFEGVINQDLLRHIDSGLTFEFIDDDLQILQEDKSAKWERLSGAIEQGVITREYAAEVMGWPLNVELTDEQTVVRSWIRKSHKALKRGDSANVPFETDKLSMMRQLAIRAKLDSAESLSEVSEAFK